MKTMGAAEAKTQFLSLIDEVQRKGNPVLVTKKGMRKVVLMPAGIEDDPLAMYKFGGGKITGDVVSPANDPEDWEYD